MTPDELFMQRALELARLGIGHVSPNPQVGCVIVHDGKIIGEGWHEKYGGPHAEVNAIRSVSDKSLLSQATVYVNLEPCSHFGKTPPCADLLIAEGVRKVVVANVDSNPLVGGKGLDKLQAAGIETVVGVLDHQARELNKRFFTFVEKQRPYIILKWAQTADGFIARSNFDSKWISNEYSRQLVHRWRSEEDAILVGTGTAMHDNPSLTVRDWSGRNPVRVVIDRHLKLPSTLHLFDGNTPTLCYNLVQQKTENNTKWIKLEEAHFIDSLVRDLHTRNIQSIVIEGGAQTLSAFFNENLWDEARVFKARQSFGSGIAAPIFRGTLKETLDVMDDELQIWGR
ncbi:MAG: bifunctional diaminohydroxyphosphoribosylaminopyrimidine deaminase/5-amino-6-(5-phosphoribosylamino)uracil reductase RibD [Cyclobacteriaceae bacterium]|jgi:diaminohydroxyphosphoribosylaminopyrimidine deaminase/5-amino-6-(5-phosphoribosylamino)uracil reductase|nr:bifunctional diaminohydroxyphosphoribosylaminopyrimidine deaminase/5-amino-6-(5-phosphoribosylamino)uracil reductase RibD [Flammeovirgaceae bacterium]